MNNVVSLSVSPENSTRNRGDLPELREKGVSPHTFEELAHELRQPLSTIEWLAYHLETTGAHGDVLRNVRQIRSMVCKAHQILDRAVIS